MMRFTLIMLLLIPYVSFGQSVATGNITAEIIGEVILLSDNNADDNRNNHGEIGLTFKSEKSGGKSILSLKDLTIRPQKDIVFDLVFRETSIKDNKGNELIIESESSVNTGYLQDEITIQIKGKAKVPASSGFYKGTCPITFAFN